MAVQSPAQIAQHARGRIRVALIVLLAGLWVLPQWVEAMVGDKLVDQTGAMRTGAPAALSLVALIALALTCWWARRARALQVGEAFGAFLIAAAMTFLLATDHPWIPGGQLREVWVPIFAPLGALALLDAWYTAKLQTPGHDNAVSRLRGLAACIGAVALAVHGAMLPAVACAWIGLPPLMLDATKRETTSRRITNALFLAAAVAAGLAPSLHDKLVGADPVVGTATTWPVYGWSILCALLATTTLGALFARGDDGNTASAA